MKAAEVMKGAVRRWRGAALKFLRANGGNVAMMFGLSLVPITIAAGAGVDLARAMAVKASMADALDAAALAVGSTPGISQSAGPDPGAAIFQRQLFQARQQRRHGRHCQRFHRRAVGDDFGHRQYADHASEGGERR